MADMPRGAGAALFVSLLLVACLLVQPAPVVAADESELQATTKQLGKLRKRMDKLRGKLNQRRGERSKQQRALEQIDTAIGTLSAQLRVTTQSIMASSNKLDELAANQRDERRALEKIHARLRRELRATYMAGQQSQVKMLLNQEDPAAFGRTLVYQGYFARSRGERMVAFKTSLARLAEIEAGLALTHEELVGLQQEQQQQSHELQAKQAEQRKVLAGIDHELADGDAQLKALKQDEKRLGELLASLRKALAEIPLGEIDEPLKTLKGKLNWPVAGRITRSFGAPTEAGRLRSRGVYIATSPDSEVRAIARGRVAFADWLRGFGLLLIIEHGDGYMSLYGHNQSLFKEAGDWVEQGEAIGLVGRSGGQTRSGVCFGIRREGKPINPAQWCRRPKGRRVG